MIHALAGSPRNRAARLSVVSPGRAKVTTKSSDSKVSGAAAAIVVGAVGRPGAGATAAQAGRRTSAATSARSRSRACMGAAASGGGNEALHLVDLHRLFLALDPEDAERAGLDHPPHLLVRPPADQDLARLRLRLEPRRQGHAVPDDGVLHLVLGADRPGDHLARAEADADGDRGLPLQ